MERYSKEWGASVSMNGNGNWVRADFVWDET
ncbi:Hypothetical protein SCLAV_1593 [Streptomyces clavuligerus]|uniref:Uncharacterized protein n=1 Tax=Streptomyces clavuligerus TaxID=1901 RepID=B5GQP9_STRCL|nr:hypothetical protein SSCG_01673 [Streptomyces clavuligerus]EFG06668.1 Hypothetical protein SCLAV_1593 [Streptomyces clavuligerus]